MKNESEKGRALRSRIYELVKEYYEAEHIKAPYKEGDPIPYCGRIYDEKELIGLVGASLDFWLTAGQETDKFEKDFASFPGVKHCSLVNSGSSANLLAFMALTSPKLDEKRILPGDEVITVAAGFPTTVTPVIQYGAVPVFAAQAKIRLTAGAPGAERTETVTQIRITPAPMSTFFRTRV